jgi:hypothetical protein
MSRRRPKRRKSVLKVFGDSFRATDDLLGELGIFGEEERPPRKPGRGRSPERPAGQGEDHRGGGWWDGRWPFGDDEPTWRDYEKAAVAFLVSLGYSGVGAAAAGADGGVDVWVTGTLVGQVKAQQTKVGSPPLQQLYGIASKENVQGLFFSKSGYSKPAIQWANSVEMPLFTVSHCGDHQFEVEPANRSAERFGTIGA